MKKRRISRGILLLIILSICIFVIGVYIKYGKRNVIKVGVFSGSNWNVPGTSYYGILEKSIDKLHEKFPNVKVEYEEGIPVDEYSEWLASQILKGTEPDIYLVLPQDFPNFVQTGSLYSLNQFTLVDKDFDGNVFYEFTYKAGHYNRMQYTLPFECNPKLMFMNKSLLKKEGIEIPGNEWDWDTFREICHKIDKHTTDNKENDQYGFYGYSWLDAVYSNNEVPFSDDGKICNFTDDNFIKAVIFAKDMLESQENYRCKVEDFDLGRVAFRPLTFADYRTYMPYPWRIKKFSQFEWNCLPMPAGPSGNNTSSMDTLMWGMSKKTANREISWELMKILTTDEEIQKMIYKDSAGASPVKNVTGSSEVIEILNQDTPGDSRIDLSLLDEVMSKAVVPKYFLGYDTAMEYTNNHIEDYYENDEELNLAMFELKRHMNKILK